MSSVDRALDPHLRYAAGSRRWSVIANRLPDGAAAELQSFLAGADPDAGRRASTTSAT
jgi:hypothetical protein